MKALRFLCAVVFSLGVVTGASAAEKKAAAKKEATAPAAGKKPAAPKGAITGKPISMYARVDSIDKAGKTFIHKTKAGEMKHVLAANAEIKNGAAAARFEDIKVGDMVSGSRIRKSAADFEVVKITKFGPAAPKAPKAEAKPAAKKE